MDLFSMHDKNDKNKIPTYIINLEHRNDRRSYIENQFEKHPEFNIKFFKAVEDRNPAFGLYKSLHGIVKIAKNNNLPYVVICEDDHEFTNIYNKDLFFYYIERAYNYHADLLLGGVSWFDCGVYIEENLYWLKEFTGTQFLVIYASFYQKILESPFNQNDIIDRWMCDLSENIFIAVPMLSVQFDFGYSDVTPKNNNLGRVSELFKSTIDKWQAINDVTAHIQKNLSKYISHNVEEDERLPTYIIKLDHTNDRLLQLQQGLSSRNEFDIHIVEYINENDDNIALWKNAVQMAKNREDEVVLICEDTHIFCSGYNKHTLWNAIYQGAYLGADLILGGISSAQQIIPASESLCWISNFQCSQFTIIYCNFFDKILSTDFQKLDTLDVQLSSLTANKYVIHPFISKRADSRSPDSSIYNVVTQQNNKINFESCSYKIDKVKSVSQIVKSRLQF